MACFAKESVDRSSWNREDKVAFLHRSWLGKSEVTARLLFVRSTLCCNQIDRLSVPDVLVTNDRSIGRTYEQCTMDRLGMLPMGLLCANAVRLSTACVMMTGRTIRCGCAIWLRRMTTSRRECKCRCIELKSIESAFVPLLSLSSSASFVNGESC